MATRRLLVEVVADNEQLLRTFRGSATATRTFGKEVRAADQNLGRATRGALAGSGVFRGLGRSIAFASGGFLAFASAGQFLRTTIDAAREAAVTQRQLQAQLKVTGQSWSAYRNQIESTLASQSRLSGFNTDDLEKSLTTITRGTGDVNRALALNSLAADIARGRNTSLAQASIAVGKAAAGSTTALRRLGIELPKGATGAQALALAQQKFAGQAAAGASAADRFSATLHNTEVIIGQALLPTVNKLLTSLGEWLDRMNRTGKLQRDVNTVLTTSEHVFGAVSTVIHGIDRVTGSFVNTLKLLAAFKLAALVTGWVTSLDALAASWASVGAAARSAGAAESGALAGGAARGAGAGLGVGSAVAGAGLLGALKKLVGRGGGTSDIAARVGRYTTAIRGTSAAATAATAEVGALSASLGALGAISVAPIVIPIVFQQENKLKSILPGGRAGNFFKDLLLPTSLKDFAGISEFNDLFGSGPKTPGVLPSKNPLNALPAIVGDAFRKFNAQLTQGARRIEFGVRPLKQFRLSFDLTPLEKLAQVQSQLTRSNADDVAAAREVVARVKRLLDQGRLHGAAMRDALGLEASALSTIWSAEDAAAQQRAAAAQAAKDRIQAQIENSIDPLKLEVALSRAQAFGRPILPRLLALLRAARKALASGDLNLTQQKEALDQITSLKQQIKDARTGQDQTFTLSPRLQLALAKDQALGRDTTKDLLKARAAILKFIRTHKHNIAALTDAYNQLADINQQLGNTAQNSASLFKKASTRALTAGLGLTEAQREELRARLSQVGPGGTVPRSGVGAGGFIIDPETGRPVAAARPTGTARRVGGRPNPFNPVIDLNVFIDGKQVKAVVTRRQQKDRRRNSTQTRGPNAGLAHGF